MVGEMEQRRAEAMARTAARLALLRRQALERLETQRARLAERMMQRGVRLGPGPAGNRRKPGPRQDREDGGVPVSPDRPKNLSGGAAAKLIFEDR